MSVFSQWDSVCAFVLSRADRHGWPRESHGRAMTISLVVSRTLHIALLHIDVSAAMGPQCAELKATKVEAPINVKLEEEEGASVALVFSFIAPVATSSLATPAAAKEAAAAPSSLSAAFAPWTFVAMPAAIAAASASDVPHSSTEELESEKVDGILRRR